MPSSSSSSVLLSPCRKADESTCGDEIFTSKQAKGVEKLQYPLGNDNNSIGHFDNECPTDDDDGCCPICYELFPHSSSTAISELESKASESSTISTDEESLTEAGECSYIDVDTSDVSYDIKEDIGIDINIDAEPKRQNTGKKSCPCHRRKRRCHPREKVTIPGCGHGFCRGCLKNHCSYAISIRDLPIRCPKCSVDDGSTRPCSLIIPIDVVRDSLLMREESKSNWTKFQRLQRMLDDPTLIPCTRCDELISPSNHDSDDDKHDDPNRICCPACQHVFCRIRGDGHFGRDCTKKHGHDDEDPSEKALFELCKPCSHCGVPIWKEKGCNHVVCPICKNDMCYKCGTHKHLGTSNGKTIRTCQACQGSYFDHRYLWRHRLGVLAKLPLMLPIYVGYMAMSIALAVATCGCFCCLGCGMRYKKTKDKIQSQKVARTIVWMPIMAMREVLGFLLLPFIDLFRECRFPCCFCHKAPGLCQGSATDDDDDDGDGDDESYYEDDEEVDSIESDIENQTRRV